MGVKHIHTYNSTHRLLQLLSLHPDVGYHDGGAVASDGVLEDVRQLGLAIGDMVPVPLGEGQSDLLQEGQGLVDVPGFTLGVANRLQQKTKHNSYGQ